MSLGPAMPTTCPRCGAATTAGAVACATCGQPLVEPGGPGGEGTPPPSTRPQDVGNLALLAHLSALVQFAGVPSFLGPLAVWLWKRDDHPFVEDQAREALNFNLSVLLYAVVGGILGFVFGVVTLGLGFVLVALLGLAVGIVWVILVVVAGLQASKGERHRYPFTIRFVR